MAESEANLAVPAARPWRRGFWSLIATQFQGAFSDNALKWLVIFLIIGIGLAEHRRDLLVILVVPLLFAVPYLLSR